VLIGWSYYSSLTEYWRCFLLGAITHQAIGMSRPVTKRGPGFFSAVRGVNGMSYANAVILLFPVTFTIGTIIYPTYRLNVRTVLQEYKDLRPEGMFELKEHFLAISLALLPAYWYFWHKVNENIKSAQRDRPGCTDAA